MFSKREMVAGASLVSGSRAPSALSAAFTEISAVSKSESRHHDDVRICRKNEPQAHGEVQADLVVHLHLVDAVQIVLDRILGVLMSRPAYSDAEGRVQRRGFPRPVGPVTSTMPRVG